MINLDKKVFDLIEENPHLKDFLVSIGFEKFRNIESVKSMAKMLTLRNILKSRGIDEESFIERYEAFNNSTGKVNDMDKSESDIVIQGVLPCPTKDVILTVFNNHFKDSDIKIFSDLRSANLGADFFTENINSVDDLPDIFISPGFEFPFFDEKVKNLFNEDNFITIDHEYNDDFREYKDPKGIFYVAGAVPSVFLSNKSASEENDIPRSWEELINGNSNTKIALPVADLDIVNAVLLTTHSKYGNEGVHKLISRYKDELHPSQMVKISMQNKSDSSLNIIPYFFGTMAVRNRSVDLIWPEDGAILSPILMAFKKGKEELMKPFIDFFTSEKFAKSMYADGKFPSSCKGVINNMPGKFK
ncbi:MAG: hypothetical protein CSB16_00095 [Clostridiales bacterium]|nr:MAG: hypothetical protein CSB16_00095 [Clostridiales bacterium]